MKIVTKLDLNYENFNYENGWHVWHNPEKIKKIMKYINCACIFVTFHLTAIFTNRIEEGFSVIKSMFFSESSIDITVLFILTFLIIYLFLIVPIHELLHLFGSTFNILSDDCYIILGKGVVSTHFDRAETKSRRLFVQVFPVIVITTALLSLIVVNPYGFGAFFLVLLYANLHSSYPDIMMFFYIMKKVPKGSIIYGNRYKKKLNYFCLP